ncbi:hypothetical protein [uncultured Paracoccus sp.]|uniref:hypothetical protein n=1 Tax=uncultured Paracoccus sp. TaxID=189685 RepID=UPI0025CBF4BC|nr:hypothetical protein [uncultured Paracoccus sp.]
MGSGIAAVSRFAREVPELVDFHHFEISREVVDFATELAVAEIKNFRDAPEDMDETFKVPRGIRLPGARMTMVIEGTDTVLSLRELGDEIHAYGHRRSCPQGLRLFRIHSDGRLFVNGEVLSGMAGWGVAARVAFILSLISEPRILRRSPAGSRQQRRAIQRGFGFAVDAWTRVTWDLSKETVAKVSHDPTFHKMPLHWRRGHFRRAAPHFKGAIQRPDALREEDRGLWWQWIEGQWVGHPAFGLKRSVHAPRLSGGDLARRAV